MRIDRSSAVRNGHAFPPLPKSAPPPPKAPRAGKAEWVKGYDAGESYATRGKLQVEVQYDFSTRWSRNGYSATRKTPAFQVSIVTRDDKSGTVLRYFYADGVSRSEAKAIAEQTLYDTSNPLYVRVENTSRAAFYPERDIQFGLTGGYVVPISARSKIKATHEPVTIKQKR